MSKKWIVVDWAGRKYGGATWGEVLTSIQKDPWIKLRPIRARVESNYGVKLPSTKDPEAFIQKLIEIGEIVVIDGEDDSNARTNL